MEKQNLPKDNSEYKTKRYWDSRYERESDADRFDWFKTYETLAPILRAEMSPESSILMLGCGNSGLSEDLYKDGFKNVTNIDFSEVIIERMSAQCASMESMSWHVMDVQDMHDISSESFDVAIDKGTMDALMCDKGDVWSPSEQLIADVKREVDEVDRVLKRGGKFIYITFGQPHFRRIHLERDSWSLTVHKIGDAFHYFVYVMQKF